MTIKKFIEIENVGRLVTCCQHGPELDRFNLIFAENGRGKTTLCAVLRSLETGKSEYISERKTLAGNAGQPTANILLHNTNARFQNDNWNITVPQIAVFDAAFVAENVHAGEHVDRDQRRNLLQVIIGENGVALAEEVDTLDKEITAKNAEINASRQIVRRHIPQGFNLDEFLVIAQDADIENKILEKSSELTAALRAGEIQVRQSLVDVPELKLPVNFQAVLSKTLEEISAEADLKIKEQIANHQMHDRGEAWLAEGLTYNPDQHCPFCGQNTGDLPLISAYRQLFSDAYRALYQEIIQLRNDIEITLGEAALAVLGQTFANNGAHAEFWGQFTELNIGAPDHDGVIIPSTNALVEAALSLIEQKLTNPLAAITTDARFNLAANDFDAVTRLLTAYNEIIGAANVAIEATKQRTQAADNAAIERDLIILQMTRLRFDPEPNADCDAFQELIGQKARLDDAKLHAKEALDGHADQMIGEYETTINRLLRGFGAGFTITNSKKTYIGGSPTSSYQILINDHAIDLGDANTPLGQPSFRTTLSAGDKSTLALAFFIAKLDHDPNKAEKIVIFDDPFNSQDRSRRERTAELLKKYGNECEQLFLFSHDPFFLKLVEDRLIAAGTRTLQLSRAADNTTTIEEWDAKKETQEGYFQDHAALNSFQLNGARQLIDVVRKIRPVLEGYLRYRFPNQFPDKFWLGDMIAQIREAGNPHPLYGELGEIEAINDYSKKFHHDTNPGQADNELVNDGELQSIVQRTLLITGGY